MSDRDAILARRALFISATLAGLACTKPAEPPQEPEPEASEPPVLVVEQTNPLRGDSEQGRPSWSALLAKAPPLNIPDMVSAKEREHLEVLVHIVEYRYEQLAKVWPLPECAPSEAECAAWAEAVEVIDDLLDDQLTSARCGYLPETTYTYLERLSAHARYVRQLSELLLDDLDAAVVARANTSDSEAWARERQRLEGPMPRVCLSCMAPTAQAITSAVMFGAGETQPLSPDEAASALQYASSIHAGNRQAKARLIVRGHASADEDGADQLGRLRAEAVAAQLVRAGVARADIEVRSYGAELPITNEASEQSQNRRVDFEVALP